MELTPIWNKTSDWVKSSRVGGCGDARTAQGRCTQSAKATCRIKYAESIVAKNGNYSAWRAPLFRPKGCIIPPEGCCRPTVKRSEAAHHFHHKAGSCQKLKSNQLSSASRCLSLFKVNWWKETKISYPSQRREMRYRVRGLGFHSVCPLSPFRVLHWEGLKASHMVRSVYWTSSTRLEVGWFLNHDSWLTMGII